MIRYPRPRDLIRPSPTVNPARPTTEDGMVRYPRPRDMYAPPIVLNPSGPRPAFMAVDRDGNIISVSDTVEEAIRDIAEASPGETYVEPELDGSEGGGNGAPRGPVSNPAGPMAALSWTGLEPLDLERDVMSISPKDAHADLMELFGLLDTGRYKTIEGMVEGLLGENEKTIKQPPPPLEASWVMGLALMPAASLARFRTYDKSTSAVSRKIGEMIGEAPARGRLPVVGDSGRMELPRQWTLCHSSSTGCREACLVRVGRNPTAYNMQVKAVRTMALLKHPRSFVRMLVEALKEHGRVAPRSGYRPFARLNVLSDIPWEEFVPDLFPFFEKAILPGSEPVQFYDYTKVAGRVPPKNYDLTFSFSGENEAAARDELARGHRVAVVFAGMYPKGARDKWQVRRYESSASRNEKGRAIRGAPVPLPKRFWDVPVEDGDEHDVRPFNPKDCIVGLRWKTPGGGADLVDDRSFSFVKRVYHVDGEVYLDEATGQQRREQLLVAAVTPDQTGAYREPVRPRRRR